MSYKDRRGQQVNYECHVEFDGLISRSVCASISKELVKYVLFQRDQIPESFDCLQRQLKTNDTSDSSRVNEYNPKQEGSQVNDRRLGPCLTSGSHAKVNYCLCSCVALLLQCSTNLSVRNQILFSLIFLKFHCNVLYFCAGYFYFCRILFS